MNAASPAWRLAAADDDAVQRLAAELGAPPPIARMLVARGWTTPEIARQALAPDYRLPPPEVLSGMAGAAQVVARAVRARRRIAVYGDFDADGVTAAALLCRWLRGAGADVVPFLPQRLADGYGLTVPTVDRCLRTLQPDLVVTVDCGTHSDGAVRHVLERGVDIVVTDHHLAVAPSQVAPTAMVNPQLGPADGPGRELAGVGVALQLVRAIAQVLGRDDPADDPAILELAAIGTVADCVPLRGTNRTLVRRALSRMVSDSALPGLRALRAVAKVGEIRDTWPLAFLLAPRLNAAGRLGTAEDALELLLTDNADRAQVLAGHLDRENRRRQEMEERILEAASAQLDEQPATEREFGVVVADPSWHPGVVGIVAGKLVARHRRPAVVIVLRPDGGGRGSCRGLESLDLTAILADCAGCLESWGGHAMAAGLDLAAGRLDDFRRAFNAAVCRHAGGALPPQQLSYDALLPLGDADVDLWDWIERAGPYGHGYPPPLWAAERLEILDWRVAKARHVLMRVRQGQVYRRAVAFQQAHCPRPQGPTDFLFELQINKWTGVRHPELRVAAWRSSPPG